LQVVGDSMGKKADTPPRPSILAPAGNKASFLAAVAAGTDAIYCGLKDFSARMEAKNFTVAELVPLAGLAREKGIQVYVALNALMKPGDLATMGGDLEELGQQVKPDGIIIQDLSLVQLAKQTGFSGEIHLSTLANVSFPGALELVRKNLEVHRVVVPRELDVDEIKSMASACPAGLSLEVFVHGALCYGVSGRCYWSSYMGGKSGLRGRCVQPCRRVYRQKGQRKRFFSCQDLSLDVLVKVLLAIPQVTAWKIEGRKKGPHYVYHSVKAYQLLRDHGTDPSVKKEALGLLALSLGRPGTHYRFLPQRVQNPVQTDVQTGSGLLVGRTKGSPQRPYVISREALYRGDVLRLGYEDEPWHAVHKVKKYVPRKGRLDLPCPHTRALKKGTSVFLVDRRDKELEQALSDLESRLPPASQTQNRPSTFPVKQPRKSIKRMKPVDLRVYRGLPGGSQQSKSEGLASVGLWLSAEALKAAGRGNGTKLWWWLPPVVWPRDEKDLKELLDKAIKAGGRNFVLNAPWQGALFAQRKTMNLWAGPFCNLANVLSIGTAASFGCAGAIVSPELGGHDVLALPKHSPIPLGIVIFGNWPLSIGRTVSQGFDTDTPFTSPKGEEAWVSPHGPDWWVYPNWVLDIRHKKAELREAGFCLFIHLFEPKPKAIRMKKRPGLWNWELGLS